MPWYEARFWSVRVIISAALTPMIVWLGRRWPLERHNWPLRTGLHLLFSVLFALARAVLEAGVHAAFAALGPSDWDRGFDGTFEIALIFGFHTGVIAYWVVLAIQSAFRYYEKFREREQEALKLELRASELRTQVAQAQLGALKMQLQPHFLFNTLNAIVVLVRQGKRAEAEQALTRLSDLLRAVLEDHEAQEVPLRRELEYLRLYLSIEQMRFSDRLVIRIDADPEVLDATVPQLALQPIVENAVRHGISRRAGQGTIEIRAFARDDALNIVVRDDGPGLAEGAPTKGHGVGLANVRARLQRLYGVEAALRIESHEGIGTQVCVILPYREYVAPPRRPEDVREFPIA